MPVLNWIGKEKVINHDKELPFRVLKPVNKLSTDMDSENLLIEGDNLEALKALMPFYYGKVKCIYIDPPYNTGKEEWIYNDKVNSPYIRKWLNKVVGLEDLERHDKWLCMMMPRLTLLKDLLREDGVIFVSIDNNEVHNLRLLMDEIFGEKNFVSCVANVSNPKGRSDDKYLASAHEYILVYKKGEPLLYGWIPEEKVLRRYNKTDVNGRKYREIDLRKTGDNDLREDRPNLFYYFYYNPKTKEFFASREDKPMDGFVQIKPIREDGKEGRWRWELDRANELKYLLYPKLMPKRKIWTVHEMDYLVTEDLIKPTTAWTKKDFNSERGTEQFMDLGFNKLDFPRPKPLGLIKHILQFTTKDNDIVLDSFAGSGTTGQAVLEQNMEDSGNRKFILVELEQKIARDITTVRLKKVIEGTIDLYHIC